MNAPSQRRLRTLTWGALPIAVLALAVSVDHIPGTNISLTVPYAAEGPGPTVDTLGKVEGTEVVAVHKPAGSAVTVDVPQGQLNMTTVSVRTNMSLAQAIGRWLVTDDTIVPIESIIPPNQTEEEVQQANTAAFTQSESAATVAAMNYLGMPVHITVANILKGSAADGTLEIDDVLVSLAGQPVSKPKEAQDIIRAHQPGDELTLTVRRGGQEQQQTVKLGKNPHDNKSAMLGVLMSSEPDDGVSVTYNLQDIGGPSAGMMFTLAVIDKLSPGDLTGNHFVAGTGTIDESGTVGPIGGIVHKVHAARDAGAELFLAPAENCAEAVSRSTGHMVVAKVHTLADATQAMADFAAGRPVETCH